MFNASETLATLNASLRFVLHLDFKCNSLIKVSLRAGTAAWVQLSLFDTYIMFAFSSLQADDCVWQNFIDPVVLIGQRGEWDVDVGRPSAAGFRNGVVAILWGCSPLLKSSKVQRCRWSKSQVCPPDCVLLTLCLFHLLVGIRERLWFRFNRSTTLRNDAAFSCDRQCWKPWISEQAGCT